MVFHNTIDRVEPSLKTEALMQQVLQVDEQLDEMDFVPWTIQRVCELTLRPRDHYSDVIKYVRAMSKVCIFIFYFVTFLIRNKKGSRRYIVFPNNIAHS